MTIEVGSIVPLPNLSDMTVSPWLLWKCGIKLRKSSLVGVMNTTAKALMATRLMMITMGTLCFSVLCAKRFSMLLFGSDFALLSLFSPGQKILSPKAISRAGSRVSDAASNIVTPNAMAVPTSLKIGTLAMAMTMYATITVTPAVKTA